MSDYLKIQEHRHDGTSLWHAEPIYGGVEEGNGLQLLDGLTALSSELSFTNRDMSSDLNPWFHTAVTIEYDSQHIEEVANALYDLPQTLYLVPTISDVDTHLVLFPVIEPIQTKVAKRCAAIIAQYIEQAGITPYSEYADHRFRLRNNLPIHYREGITLDAEKMIEDGYGQITKIRSFYRR